MKNLTKAQKAAKIERLNPYSTGRYSVRKKNL